ncbi:NAD(P)H-hydrate epimerase [Microbacterium sulfonylureivorans]|uniref:NAD(P)H-hydrate epimerase n=1 Tax=Microbacterium sulfonylureivorans TaxID=2486854 RepID=UPI000FDC9D90|nr:NAD(P)H-hydrate epimerase [Microbacterium sulfonylureivorans]
MAPLVQTYTAEQVRAAEHPLLDAGEPLMRRAASALAAVVRERVQDASSPRILVLAGSGDNGGDALYAAAELTAVATVDVLAVGTRVHELALGAARRAGARVVDLATAVAEASDYTVVLDGILGIGTSPESSLRGPAREVVSWLLPLLRDGMPRTIAVDLPSGLHPDTGAADDVVLPAAVTVTFGAVKAGLVTGRGPELAGDVVLVDLGLGPGLAGEEAAGEASVARVIVAQAIPRPRQPGEQPPPPRAGD